MANVNTATISGNLTRDVELKEFGEGGKVANLGIAVNRRFKKGDDYVEEVSFIDVTVWGQFADLVARKLRKGDSATIQGRLKQDVWEKDGEKRSKVVLIADQIDSEGFFRSKDEDNDTSAPAATSESTPAAAAAPASDDIPF